MHLGAQKESEPLLTMNIQDGKNYDAQNTISSQKNTQLDSQMNYQSFEDKAQRTLFQRTFGAMDKGSVRGSIFTLCSVTVGTGMLALPYTFKNLGVGLGLIVLTLATFSSVWSQRMIVEAAGKAKVLDYAHLVRAAGGKRAENILNCIVLIYKTGSCTSF